MTAPSSLSPAELQRYSRHLMLPQVGLDGQARLKRSSVLIVGAGGLGSPVALYLAAAGVGRLGIVDFDRVDVTNLQRQVLHGTADVGRPKTESARARLADLNPHVEVELHETTLTAANAMEIIAGYDVVVDGTDNFQTRYLTNDACVLLGTPNVYGSVFRFEGQASVFATPDGPCYRCLFREPPPPGLVPSCAEGGVLGVLPGMIGTIQATETLKLLTGIGETLAGRLLLVDALRMHTRTIAVRRDPACPACGTREIRALIDYDAFCGVAPAVAPAVPSAGAPSASSGASGPEAVAADGTENTEDGEDAFDVDEVVELAPRALAGRLQGERPPVLLDVREPWEHDLARLPASRLVPLGELPERLDTLDPRQPTVLYCHHGMRSRMAAELLKEHGFLRVANLAGGIDRWSVEVDPSVPRY